MSGRRNIQSDESGSAYSGASSIARNAEVAREWLAAHLEQMSDYAILNRALTLRTTISTHSSFARRFQNARSCPELQEINQIGAGLQGVIFEQVGQPLVLKKESPGNDAKTSNLRHEYEMHCAVSTAFDLYNFLTNNSIHVPRPMEFISKTGNDVFWDSILPKIPAAYRERGDIVKMQRILPLPKVVRKALITRFSDCEHAAATVNDPLADPENKHCLVRLYLGKADGQIGQGRLSLRNFPLYLQSMKHLDMDINEIASAMGKAYATMHWGAAVTGDDVEFVLGTSTAQNERAEAALPDFQHRVTGIYLLDFGQCETVDLTQEPEVVYQAFKAAMVLGDNQLFIPHYLKTPALFAEFKKGYTQAGNIILAERKLETQFSMADFMQEYEEYAEDFL
ncbi:hypothetical protein PENDEC_c022G02980 [Penicillium decumbens]|uniref:DUF3669 domain-containing protein n=1 Tax=Penicillium decumbens TaxID=69771 RepID=A0A1V6P0U9_PENDC|nr:hypothetical protein PENDEC_c022G02980 [Penicillium decumbens]